MATKVMSARVFSIQIKKALEDKKMTQSELARKTGVTETSISRYLSGQREPKWSCAVDILSALDCSCIELERIEMEKTTDEIKEEILGQIAGLEEDIEVLKSNIAEAKTLIQNAKTVTDLEQIEEFDLEKGLNIIELF